MKKGPYTKLASTLICSFIMISKSNAEWKPAESTMMTQWGENVTPENAWTEYPRPQMVRENWTNFNGLWDFAVTPRGAAKPKTWKSILVPFALETPLSGIGRRLGEKEVIWYRRNFDLPTRGDGRTLLHFEGVDYACRVWVNNEYAGSHMGGNLPFSFDVTSLLKENSNEVVLRVVDDTDSNDRYQLRGKQRRDNKGIWYTPSSGIWQTVWMEEVPSSYLERIKLTGDMDGNLSIKGIIEGDALKNGKLRVSVMEGEKSVSKKSGPVDGFSVKIKNPRLWSPEDPYLYNLSVELIHSSGKVIDQVDSYVGFRTIGKEKDAAGHWRFTLNGSEIFHLGPLDQGWWPDGFLNPPADEAIVFEMEFLKKAGFNMIRKHKKVEPRRYYYHADRMGFLVWQDHVSGGAGPNEWPKWKRLWMHGKEDADWAKGNNNRWKPGDKVDADWPAWAHQQSMAELKTMIDTLYNNPSVVVWTAFNERWGQHLSMDIGKWIQSYDSTRYLNIASGGNFFEIGDIADEHSYPDPEFPLDISLYDDYVKVVGEFGGHGWLVEGHQWDTSMRNWGYGGLPSSIDEYKDRYRKSAGILGELKSKGIAAGVYTQTTDVEGEINGLMTYDRKVFKMEPEELSRIHTEHGIDGK